MMDAIEKLGLAALDALQAHDKFMSGQPITDEENRLAKRASLAACFAVEAYDRGFMPEDSTHAAMRAFLQCLADPTHADLDYLRASADKNEGME